MSNRIICSDGIEIVSPKPIHFYSSKGITMQVEAVPVFLTDTKRQKQLCFWKVAVEEVDCLKWENPMRYDNLTVIAEDTDHRFLFRIAFDRQEYLVVSLPLAEHMLRKNLCGIQYIPLLVEYEED